MEQVNLTTEQVVLAERDTTDQITVSETETVVISGETAVTIVSGMMGPRGAAGGAVPISQIPDVDLTGIQDGSVLAYSSLTGKWQATNSLSNQIFEAGQF